MMAAASAARWSGSGGGAAEAATTANKSTAMICIKYRANIFFSLKHSQVVCTCHLIAPSAALVLERALRRGYRRSV